MTIQIDSVSVGCLFRLLTSSKSPYCYAPLRPKFGEAIEAERGYRETSSQPCHLNCLIHIIIHILFIYVEFFRKH